MPTYCYKGPDGSLHEWTGPIAKRPSRLAVFIDGKPMYAERDLVAEHSGFHAMPSLGPYADIAVAVHPSQQQEAIESAKHRGVSTDFDRTGRPHFTSTKHRENYYKEYDF